MSGIYDKNGNFLSSAYDKNGNSLSLAYDKNGNVIWSAVPAHLRVANYNVGDWYIGAHNYVPETKKEQYENLQRTIFQNMNADVCCMQEAPPKFCQDGTLASTFLDDFFPYIEVCTSSTSSSIPYRTNASKYPIENFQMIQFPTGGTGTTVTYEKFYITVEGRRICIVESHLSLTKSYAITEAHELIDAVDGEQYYIIMGDFNTGLHSDEDYTQDEDYLTIVKPFLDAGMNSANVSTFGAFETYGSVSYEAFLRGEGYMSATDHIFTSPNITIADVWVERTKLTDSIADKIDHIPIVADLVIN